MIVDTHVLLWMDGDDPSLGQQARHQIKLAWPAGQIAVSAISFWEVAMLAERKRIALPMPVAHWRELATGRPRRNSIDSRIAC
jgi:PIN domain nuclease of toxin-antitoxin system